MILEIDLTFGDDGSPICGLGVHVDSDSGSGLILGRRDSSEALLGVDCLTRMHAHTCNARHARRYRLVVFDSTLTPIHIDNSNIARVLKLTRDDVGTWDLICCLTVIKLNRRERQL